MTALQSKKFFITVGVVLVLAIAGYYILNMPDRRSPGQKIGDAINELDKGVDKATRQLESRTPGDKLQDAIEDEKEDIKRTLDQQ